MHHPTDRVTHTTAFVTPVVGHWLEREIAQWVHPMKDRSDDPSHHERTLLPRSYISLIFDGDVHNGEQFSFPMNFTSCSEQMDVPESIDVITNVMPPIVFWNIVVSVVAVSWYGQGFTMKVVRVYAFVRVNGNTQCPDLPE